MLNQKPLRFTLLGLNDRTSALLELYFKGAGRQTGKIVDATLSEASIVDFDSPSARSAWTSYQQEYGRPAIALSVSECADENAVWVQKPIDVAKLSDAANRLREKLGAAREVEPIEVKPDIAVLEKARVSLSDAEIDNIAQSLSVAANQDDAVQRVVDERPQPKIPPKPTFPPEPEFQVARPIIERVGVEPSEEPLAVEERPVAESVSNTEPAVEAATTAPEEVLVGEVAAPIEEDFSVSSPVAMSEVVLPWQPSETELCGDREDLDLSDPSARGEIYYAVGDYLQVALQEARSMAKKTRRPVQISLVDEQIVFFPARREVYISFDHKVLIQLCTDALDKNRLRTHVLSEREVKLIDDQSHGRYINDEAFIWLSALLTAKGRLPQVADLTKAAYLKWWPNFTRLDVPPNSMRIVALWDRKQTSLADTVEVLQIPQREVFAFYSAAAALGLIETCVPQQPLNDGVSVSKEKRGFFSRILRRLSLSK